MVDEYNIVFYYIRINNPHGIVRVKEELDE